LLLLSLSLAFSIDHKILEDSENEQYASFSIHLKSKANLSGAKLLRNGEVKGWYVYNALKDHAEETQKPIIQFLSERTDVKSITPFWISNFIIVEAKRSVIDLLKQRSDIRALNSNRPFKVNLEGPDSVQILGSKDANEWNVDYVKANLVWETYGSTGENTIYANADTGVDWTHDALANYKGRENATNHNYNWWDGVKEAALPGAGRCGINSQVPCDDNSHGTHTTGTSVGLGGIGVAPGSKWIGCRNMDRGYGTVASYMSCLQFFLAPTDLKGENANPSVRPHAIGNSYGCVSSEGCAGDEFREAVESLRAAGVFMSVSAGNSGPTCSSMRDPPATEESVISVGALAYRSDGIASYSSRGPVDAMTRPNLVAPGSSVRSCVPGGGYSSFSGTSMASPHIGGAVVLLISICPELAYDVDALQQLLEETARGITSNQGCGNDTPTSIPNNVFGKGLIDILKAADLCTSRK